MSFTYDYPRPLVTTDCLIFSGKGDEMMILLIRRGRDPFKGMWALPGGFLEMDEELEDGALRELREETGLENIKLRQLFTIGTLGRDPRGRTISVVYYGLAYHRSEMVMAGDDAICAKWFPVKKLPELAFDHKEVVEKAMTTILF